MPTLLIILVAALLFLFWLTQLLDLLRRTDGEFPSPSDRIIWTLLILLLPALGAMLYWLLKPLRIAVESSDSLKRELSDVMSALRNATPDSGKLS
jgi:hypothetical protein